MKETNDLTSELMSTSNLDSYLDENAEHFSNEDVAQLLMRMFEQRNITKAELARRASISEVYLHQVFSGRRSPSRDRLICLCIAFGASLEETQEMLRRAVYAQLYLKNKRDAIIGHGIMHGTGLNEINDTLFAQGEKTLS